MQNKLIELTMFHVHSNQYSDKSRLKLTRQYFYYNLTHSRTRTAYIQIQK